MNDQLIEHCRACGAPVDPRAELCVHCGVRLKDPPRNSQVQSTKLAAGICGILIGSLGIHKFILGITTPAIIMLVLTVATCGIAGIVTGIIGFVEGIIYLTRSDEEFEETYIIGKKPWF
jgi:TM2 domain-containing membrane protein YozV